MGNVPSEWRFGPFSLRYHVFLVVVPMALFCLIVAPKQGANMEKTDDVGMKRTPNLMLEGPTAHS